MIYRLLIVGLFFCLTSPVHAQSLLDRVTELERIAALEASVSRIEGRLESIDKNLARLGTAPMKAVADCACGCVEGQQCTCATCPALQWYALVGTNDLGLFHGEAYVGRWYADTRTVRRFDRQQPAYGNAFTSQGGGCASGSCGSGRGLGRGRR